MPKIKTNRAAAKRFKRSGTGKILMAKSGRHHFMIRKSAKRKRSLRQSGSVYRTDAKMIRRLLPNG